MTMAFFKCNSFYVLMSSLHEAESRRGFPSFGRAGDSFGERAGFMMRGFLWF